MLSLIVFGIIAVIVIVFLLNINIRAMSRSENAESQVNKQSEMPLSNTAIPRSEMLENQLPESTGEWPVELPQIPKLPQMSDEQYRQALRQFHSSQSVKPAPTSGDKLNDTAYRSALRSIQNQTKKD